MREEIGENTLLNDTNKSIVELEIGEVDNPVQYLGGG